MLAVMLNGDGNASRSRVAYGTIVSQIRDLSKYYKEAKMALEVGKIFYPEATVNAYHTLGIGRLIYQLPQPLCEMFMSEVFKENTPDTFDEETLSNIEKFFENNLNVSETARQLFVHRNTSVSYTHLDVYKRQHQAGEHGDRRMGVRSRAERKQII